MKAILEKAKAFAVPTKLEEKKISETVKKILQKVNGQLKKSKVNAELIVGGSVAKGTWLPGISDIDFFMRFDYNKYKNKSGELDNIAEKVLKKCFKINRLHGSRDYFSLQQAGFYIEIVPVLKITNPKQAKNITDVSPLHINWIKKQIKKKPEYFNEMRLSKQFFKANGLYGAESYIKGFSGHVIEILVVYYGSFLKLLKGISKYKKKQIIDIEKKYKTPAKALEAINPDKTQGPLIIIDPIEAGRNAAAALGNEKLNLAVKVCEKFLAKPNIEFFKIKPIKIKDLVAKKKKRKLIILQAEPEKRKIDIAGAKLLKKFELLKEELTKEGFKISEADWWWDEKGPALFWFYLDPKSLSKTKIHWGPPVSVKEEFIKGFKRSWKKSKIKKTKGRYYVEIKRKFIKPEDFLKNLIKKIKKLKIARS